KFAVGGAVFGAGAAHYLLRQFRSRRLFVPADLFQVVAHVLLVVGLLRPPRSVARAGPKTRRIRGQHLVSQHRLPAGIGRVLTELELGIGQNDAAGGGVVGGAPVYLQAEV